MSKTRQILIISLIIVFFLPTTLSFSQQSNIQSDIDFLNKEEARFLNYLQDFEAFAKSHVSNSLEVEIAINLNYIANRAEHYLISLETLLTVYEKLSCEADRVATKPLIKQLLDHYVRELDAEIKGSILKYHLRRFQQ